MYKCTDCGGEFEEARKVTDYEGEMTWRGTQIYCCPWCGSPYIEDGEYMIMSE